MTKPTDLPDLSPKESSAAIAWWSLDPTVAVFDQTIGSSKYLAGRQVFESANGAASDTCYFATSKYAPGGLSGGGWFVGYYYFNNRWEYDYVGMLSNAVAYYRSMHRVPCLITIPQTMNIYARGGLSSYQYFTDTLYWNVPDNVNYGSARAGVQAWRTWP